MTSSVLALLLYAGWTLALLTAIALMRCWLVLTQRRPAHAFAPSGDDVSPFSGRLCRAHANCCENLPVFGALVLTAMITGHAQITDPAAMWVLAARIGQSTSHLVSGKGRAVAVRFGCLMLQIGIQAVWIVHLLQTTS